MFLKLFIFYPGLEDGEEAGDCEGWDNDDYIDSDEGEGSKHVKDENKVTVFTLFVVA